jgi:hypothetical protein
MVPTHVGERAKPEAITASDKYDAGGWPSHGRDLTEQVLHENYDPERPGRAPSRRRAAAGILADLGSYLQNAECCATGSV